MENKKRNSINTNMDRMKLLTVDDNFLLDIKIIRDYPRVVSKGKRIIYNHTNALARFEVIIDNEGVSQELTDYLREKTLVLANKNNLPLNFCPEIAFYIIHNIVTVPAYNFDIVNIKDENGKVINFFTKVYSKYQLTKKERKIRDKKEKELAKEIYKDKPLRNPSRKMNRNISILKKSKKKGTEIADSVDPKIKYKYSDRDIAAEIYSDKCSEKNIDKLRNNIRKSRSRTKKKIKEINQ